MSKHLNFAGHDTVALARKYGTPLYVMSEDIVRERIEVIKNAFESVDANYEINFAGKAFLNIGMCKIVSDEGISLDVASGGELYTALRAGFNPEKICFHGNNKSEAELAFAIESRVGRIVVDNDRELSIVERLAEAHDTQVSILFRIAPGIEAHTHELIQTGKEDTKFGLPLQLAEETIKRTLSMNRIHLIGLHCHIGSQIVDESPFIKTINVMMKLYKKVVDLGIPLKELNLGGGFGISYLPGDPSFHVKEYLPKMVEYLRNVSNTNGIEVPKVVIEPGRALVAPAGITLYTVGAVKDIPGVRKYVSVDGGLMDNPRPALYGAEYYAQICDRPDVDEDMEIVTVSGKACETDRLIADITLCAPKSGDTLAVFETGAYNYTMANNYNRFPRPTVVLLKGDRSEILVRRETYEDIVARDCVPSWLGDDNVQ